MHKPILYLDMDGVIVNFPETIETVPPEWRQRCDAWCRETGKHHSDFPGIFRILEPMPNAIDSIEILSKEFEIYILSSPPWDNPSAWSDKRNWVDMHLPQLGRKRLILSHRKDLNRGLILVDDRSRHGAFEFGQRQGQAWLHFDETAKWPNFVDKILSKKEDLICKA